MAGVEVVPEIIKKEKKQRIGERYFRSYQIAGGKMTSLINFAYSAIKFILSTRTKMFTLPSGKRP